MNSNTDSPTWEAMDGIREEELEDTGSSFTNPSYTPDPEDPTDVVEGGTTESPGAQNDIELDSSTTKIFEKRERNKLRLRFKESDTDTAETNGGSNVKRVNNNDNDNNPATLNGTPISPGIEIREKWKARHRLRRTQGDRFLTSIKRKDISGLKQLQVRTR